MLSGRAMADTMPEGERPVAPGGRILLRALVLVVVLGAGCRRAPKNEEPSRTTLTTAEAPFTSPPVLAGTPDVAALVAKVSPSVVNITATQELRRPGGFVDPFDFFFGQRAPRGRGRDEVMKRRGLGSGFIIDAAGHVVTNAHVVENATTVRVTLSDEREFDAKVRGRDVRLDVAILALEGGKDLPFATLGQSEGTRVGEYVVAIGNPFGLGNTVTMGIVSAKGREIGAGPYDDFIQTDASINPGNSGGPLFNLRGEVVGISTAVAAGAQGIGFAIPIDAAKDVVPQLLEKGFVARGRLGVTIQDVDAQLANALGLDKPKGALISEVEPGSAAEKAGLKAGDVIVGVDDIEVNHAHELPRLIARRAPGTRATLTVVGKGSAPRKVQVTLDELREEEKGARAPSAPNGTGVRGGFGLELGDSPRGDGAAIRGVDPGSAAAESLRPGDTIVEVNGARVRNAREAAARLRETPADRPALVRVERDGRSRFVALERE